MNIKKDTINEEFSQSRRDFLQKISITTFSLGIFSHLTPGLLSAHEIFPLIERVDITLYHKLLKEWCDALILLQSDDINDPESYGGFHCPACGFIHGRCPDTVFPLLYMAELTHDHKYVDAALKVYEWGERNVSMPDGSWKNDAKGNPWNGITVFGAIALGESLKHHAHLLDAKTSEAWTERLRKACNFLYGFITEDTSNVNYPLCSAYAFALGGKILNEPKFLMKGKEMAYLLFKYLTPIDRFIYGELKPRTQSPRGYFPVDLSYNVEETLPMLTLYGLEMQDEAILKAVANSWETHIAFMLPDGGWDDSFGTRNHKWTYWGSRNSDGCQAGLALLSERNPLFGEAAFRNGKMLEQCTVKGILYGGPHYLSHGVQPCIHHTFSHAKSLATLLNNKKLKEIPFVRTPLPRESADGLKTYQDVGTHLIAFGKWRATITANDTEYLVSPHASGGSLSLLWHEDMGLLLTDSLFPELKLREPLNMQKNSDALQLLLTPRLEMLVDQTVYRSSRDLGAMVTPKVINGEIQVSVNCKLLSADLKETPGSTAAFQIDYLFFKAGVEIGVTAIQVPPHDSLVFYLPVVSTNEEPVHLESSQKLTVKKRGGDLKITTNGVLNIARCDKNRVFSQSPGVEAIPLNIVWDIRSATRLTLKIGDQ